MIIIHYSFSRKTHCYFCSFFVFYFYYKNNLYLLKIFGLYMTWLWYGIASPSLSLCLIRSTVFTKYFFSALLIDDFDSVCLLKLFCFVFFRSICWCCLTFKSFHFWGYVFVIICVTYRFTLALISIMNIALSSLVLFSFVSCILFSNAFAFVTRDYIVVI